MEEWGLWPVWIATGGSLIGAIIGAGASIYTTYVLARRQEAAEARQRAAERREEVKVAARLISDDLQLGSIVAEHAEKKGTLAPAILKVTGDNWWKYKEVLARELSLPEWHAVEAAARSLIDYQLVAQSMAGKQEHSEGIQLFGKDQKAYAIVGIAALKNYVA